MQRGSSPARTSPTPAPCTPSSRDTRRARTGSSGRTRRRGDRARSSRRTSAAVATTCVTSRKGVASSTPFLMMRTSPVFSTTKRRPSGANASPAGCERPDATVVSWKPLGTAAGAGDPSARSRRTVARTLRVCTIGRSRSIRFLGQSALLPDNCARELPRRLLVEARTGPCAVATMRSAHRVQYRRWNGDDAHRSIGCLHFWQTHAGTSELSAQREQPRSTETTHASVIDEQHG